MFSQRNYVAFAIIVYFRRPYDQLTVWTNSSLFENPVSTAREQSQKITRPFAPSDPLILPALFTGHGFLPLFLSGANVTIGSDGTGVERANSIQAFEIASSLISFFKLILEACPASDSVAFCSCYSGVVNNYPVLSSTCLVWRALIQNYEADRAHRVISGVSVADLLDQLLTMELTQADWIMQSPSGSQQSLGSLLQCSSPVVTAPPSSFSVGVLVGIAVSCVAVFIVVFFLCYVIKRRKLLRASSSTLKSAEINKTHRELDSVGYSPLEEDVIRVRI